MVLVNDKKLACGTCIKGHRVSACTHTDRPLFEVKKKGRPTTQCVHCREKRKGSNSGSVHIKCECTSTCGDTQISQVLASEPPVTSQSPTPIRSSQSELDALVQEENVETRKGVPGSAATFPNGLRDVHDMAQAAQALSFMGGEGIKVAERQVKNLLNPCHCAVKGPCICCKPKRERLAALASPHSGPETPKNGAGSSSGLITDSLVEMFKSKATTSTPAEPSNRMSSSSSASQTWLQLMAPTPPLLSPDNMHHPAHTSRHIHKTKLYSPYLANGSATPRNGSRRESTLTAPSRGKLSLPAQPQIRPLTDMSTFLSAVYKEDGTVATEIPRSALGLPGITAFDAMAQNGGVKIEGMNDTDVDMLLSFPTNEDVVIGACTCGPNCECPGCATHGTEGGQQAHVHDGSCGADCKSCFNCSENVMLPSGITSIEHLLSLAAAHVPTPVRYNSTALNAHDISVLPPSVHVNEDAARSHGLVQLKPLECCNGRCQCAPGECTCENSCCGCCIRCACDEDGDQSMAGSEGPTASHPTSKPSGACCGDASSSAEAEHLAVSPVAAAPLFPPTSVPLGLTVPKAGSSSRQSSPHASGTSTPTRNHSIELRRSISSSHKYADPHLTNGSSTTRRATVSAHHGVNRTPSIGKTASKQPRPILPKPASNGGNAFTSGHLMPPKTTSCGSSACPPSMQRATSSSSRSSRASSPEPSTITSGLSTQPPNIAQPNAPGPDVPPEDEWDLSALAGDSDFLAYISSLGSSDNVDPPLYGNPAGDGYDAIDFGAAVNEHPDQRMPSSNGNLVTDLGYPQWQDVSAQPNMTVTGPIPTGVNDQSFTRSVGQEMSFAPYNGHASTYQVGANVQRDRAGFNAFPDTRSGPIQAYPSNITDMYNMFGQSQVSDHPASRIAPTYDISSAHPNVPWNSDSVQTHAELAQSQTRVQPEPPDNPNMIDLSKPLNAADIERIFRALQRQNPQQQTQPYVEPPLPIPIPLLQPQPIVTSNRPYTGLSGDDNYELVSPDGMFDEYVFDPNLIKTANGFNQHDLGPPGQSGGGPVEDAEFSWEEMSVWADQMGLAES